MPHAHDQDDAYPPPDEWLIAAPRNRPDRWAHRRGEPRGWALLWSCYLLGACILALFAPASRWSFDPQQVRASCALLLALILLGASVVWPLVRLSQVPPRVPSRAAAVDLLIVLAPAAAILAPMGVLTDWSGATIASLGAALASWCTLTGGALALTMRARRARSRAGAMLFFLALAGTGPLVGLLLAWRSTGAGAPIPPDLWRAATLASPVGAPFALVGFPSLRAPNPDPLAWELALAPLVPASFAWFGAIVVDLVSSPRPPRPPGPPRPDRPRAGYH